MNQQMTMEADTILNRLTAALINRLDERCADLTVLFERGTKKDLESFFPVLIDHIFGPQGNYSWGLRTIVADRSCNDFTALLNFLKPMGPVFKLIYNLLKDPMVKYEFSLAYLPLKVRQMLDSPNVHPFYSEVLHYNVQNKQIVSLLLNPFDYYMFHFAYHLINPCHQRLESDDQWNTVYYNLCVEYFLHFFPTGIEYHIAPQIHYYHGKNPTQTMQPLHRSSRQSPLLKPSLFTDPGAFDFTSMQQHDKHPRNEIWRSETILMACFDFWLGNNRICNHYGGIGLNAPYAELPSADYIRIIRVLVKHMHAFASTASYDMSPLGELKKITLPMMQTRMYVFLRNLIYRWPLDESFRLVLELWLSFIQPWRYSHDVYMQTGGIQKMSNQNVTANGNKADQKHVGEEYMPFIAENLLAYVVIFQQLLPRFMRIDLSSPKNAQMLFRLTKVFNQPNLVSLIRKIEAVVENKNYSPNHTVSFALNTLPPLSPTSNWSSNNTAVFESRNDQPLIYLANFDERELEVTANKYSSLIRQRIYELEGANFRYKSLFLTTAAVEVQELLQMIKMAEIRADELLKQKIEDEKGMFGFFAFFNSDPMYDKISMIERQKAPIFLNHSAENIMQMFMIDQQTFAQLNISEDNSVTNRSRSTSKDESFPYMLTPERVKQRLNDIKYEGDPDLIPIRSYEITFLVRSLYTLSCKINEQCGDVLHNLYYEDSYSGRFARNFIQQPQTIYKFVKNHGRSQRVTKRLPARISLRRFARQSFVITIILGCLSFYICNYSPFSFISLYIFYYITWYMAIALFDRSQPAPAYQIKDGTEWSPDNLVRSVFGGRCS